MVCVSKRNLNVQMAMEFMVQLIKVFENYFGVFDEERIR